MDVENVNQNLDPKSNNSQPESSSALRFFSLELFTLLFLVIITLILLNYFNVLSLSSIFPKYLGWLPHKQSNVPNSKISVSVTPTPLKTKEKTVEEMMLQYESEVLKPEFIASSVANLRTEDKNDKRTYAASANANGVRITDGFAESIKSERFRESGLPLNLGITVSDDQDYSGSDSAKADFAKYFINVPDLDTTSSRDFKIGSKSAAFEMVWKNKDGTKESRSSIRFDTKDSKGNPITKITYIACKLYKENPLYSKNTCYE